MPQIQNMGIDDCCQFSGRTNRRNITAVLLLLLCLLTLSKSAAAQEGALQFFSSAEDNFTVEISGNALILDNLPRNENFNYVLLDLINDNSQKYNSNSFSGQNKITYGLDNLKDGNYYLEIYTSPQKYGTYRSFIYGKTGIKLKIAGNEVIFVNPETLSWNLSLFKSRRTDKNALDYYLLPSQGVESDNDEIIQLAQKITKGLTTDYEKLKAIYSWVCVNISYDYDVFYDRVSRGEAGALETLHTGRSVCQGYASLTAALLRAANIPAKIVSGYALGIGTDGEWTKEILQSDKTNHAWNEAYAEGRWVILDTTWDSDNKYENGKFKISEREQPYRYFDSTPEIFSLSHKLQSDDSEVAVYYKGIGKEAAFADITVSPASKTLYVNGKKNSAILKVNIPDSLKKYDVKTAYKTSDSKVVRVDKKGKITAVKKGRAVITVTIRIADHKLIQKVKVNVTN